MALPTNILAVNRQHRKEWKRQDTKACFPKAVQHTNPPICVKERQRQERKQNKGNKQNTKIPK